MNRLRDLVYESSFPPLWITVRFLVDDHGQYCGLVELIHNISLPGSDIRELNRLTAVSLVQTLNALEWFSVFAARGIKVRTCTKTSRCKARRWMR